jgi:hypothetical protein
MALGAIAFAPIVFQLSPAEVELQTVQFPGLSPSRPGESGLQDEISVIIDYSMLENRLRETRVDQEIRHQSAEIGERDGSIDEANLETRFRFRQPSRPRLE